VPLLNKKKRAKLLLIGTRLMQSLKKKSSKNLYAVVTNSIIGLKNEIFPTVYHKHDYYHLHTQTHGDGKSEKRINMIINT
jgi:hypothetical protein